MKLYAAGFNAWGQLQLDPSAMASPGEPDDVAAFTCVLDDARIDRVWPSLTSTQVSTSRGVLQAGALLSDAPAASQPGPDRLCCEALNGRVAVYSKTEGVVRQYASARHGLDLEFALELPGVVQMVAYDVGFAALTLQGHVWTWGDGRFPECLGRDAEDAPADRPGRVTALDGLPSGPIAKVVAGGYALAALTRGQDMYCWGRYLARQQHAPVLAGLAGEPEPVVVVQSATHDELDVVDVGMGEAHMVVLASDGCVYVVGSSANGQLGLGEDVQATAPSAWAKVEGIPAGGQTVAGVYAGPRSSFIVVDG